MEDGRGRVSARNGARLVGRARQDQSGVARLREITLVAAGVMAVVALSLAAMPARAADPRLTTQASSSGFPIGVNLFDTATLGLGDNPTGSITFRLYGPNDASCSAGAIFQSVVPVNGNGNYRSGDFTSQEAGMYQWIATYGGDANNSSVANACGDPAEQTSVGKRTTNLSGQASGTVPVGGEITDTATLGNGLGPTGSITFRLYGPLNTTCAAPIIATSTKPEAGNGQYTSDPFTPTQAGVYKWIALYSGDSNNIGSGTLCSDPDQSVTVTPGGLLTPTLTTAASPSVAVGGQITDTATLGGGLNPTGSITFTLFGPDDANCSTLPKFTSTKTVTGNGQYTSDAFPPSAAGTYRWQASYTGDVAHNGVATACNDANESVVVTGGGPVTPTLSTTASPSVAVGGQVTDTATLAGGLNPTGSMTFTLFGPDDATCASTAVFTNTKTVTGNGGYISDPFVPNAPGTYRWIAAYSGDAGNNAVTTPCNDANESVVVTPGGGPVTPTLSTTASPSVPVGGQITDTATLAGGASPTGTITFNLFGPDDATCSGAVAFIDTASVSGNGQYTSDPFTPTAAGTYRWRAGYGGDAGNNVVSNPCNDPGESVVVTSGSTTTSTTTTLPGGTTTSTSSTLPTSTTSSTVGPTTSSTSSTTPPTSTTTTLAPTSTTTSTTVAPTTSTSVITAPTTTSTTRPPVTSTSVQTFPTTTTPPASTTTAPTTSSTTVVPGTSTTTTTVAVAALAASTTTTTVAGSAPGAPSVQAAPNQGPPGQPVVLSGSGFNANEPLTATFNSTPVVLATFNATAAGTFSVTVRIPADATPGRHTIVVAGTSGRSASTPFTVVAPSPTAAAPATTASAPLPRTGLTIRDPLALAALLLFLGNCALLFGNRRRIW